MSVELDASIGPASIPLAASQFGKIDAILIHTLDGYETSRQIRSMEAKCNIHTIIIGMHNNDIRDDLEVQQSGMDDCLVRPITAEAIRWCLLKHSKAGTTLL